MGWFARASNAVARFLKRPSGAVRAESFMLPMATRTWRDLTPDQADAAQVSAQMGLIRLACDVCDDLLTDDRIAGVLETRTLGMLGLPRMFEGADLPEWESLAPEGELSRLLTWGLFLGIGFAHIEADGSLRWWHSRNFDYNRATAEWYVNTSDGRECVTGSPDWVIYAPYGMTDAALSGIWVSVVLPELVKVYSLHDRARASEVFGSAMVVGKAPEGATEEKRIAWLQKLKQLARSTRLVLPDGYNIELLEAQGQTWGIYQQSIEWADNAITIRIAGQLVTTQGGSAFSRGDIHEKIAKSLLCFGEATFSTCLATQYVPRVWGVVSKPRWLTVSPDDLIGLGTAIKALADGVAALEPLLSDDGLEVDMPAYCKRFGILTRPKALQAAQAPSPTLKLVAGAPNAQGYERVQATAIPTVPPDAFRIFKMGANVTDYGVRYYTEESARLIMAAQGNRDVMIDLEHLSLYKDEANFDPDARGWGRLQARPDGLWCRNVKWTADGNERITSRKQRGISPVALSRKSDGVFVALHNLALTAMPATHDGVILIAASKGSTMLTLRKMLGLPPEATIDDILKALGLDATASASDAVNAIAKALEASGEDSEPDNSGEAPPADSGGTPPMAADDAPPAKDTKQEAASRPAPRAANDALSKRLDAIEKRDEERERAMLIASRELTPAEKNLLSKAPISSVREFVAAKPPAKSPKPGAKDAEATEAMSAGLDAVAKATGLSATATRDFAKKGMSSNG
jgi:hypothetical protein